MEKQIILHKKCTSLVICTSFVGGNFSNLHTFCPESLVICTPFVLFLRLQCIENQSFAIKKTRSYKIFCKDILTRKRILGEK